MEHVTGCRRNRNATNAIKNNLTFPAEEDCCASAVETVTGSSSLSADSATSSSTVPCLSRGTGSSTCRGTFCTPACRTQGPGWLKFWVFVVICTWVSAVSAQISTRVLPLEDLQRPEFALCFGLVLQLFLGIHKTESRQCNNSSILIIWYMNY